jgi:hypothetical protein
VTIDLGPAFAGYTSNPSYTAADVVNGTLTISGKTATFQATACGLASWQVTVKDSAGSSKTTEMVAFADAAPGATCP